MSKDGGHIWQSSDGKHTYAFISGDPNAAEGATLVVDDKLTVKHYHAGDLGLTLDGAAVTPSTTNNTFIGDSGFNFINAGEGNNLIVGNGAPSSPDPIFSTGGERGDIIIAGSGNNQIYAGTQVDMATALAQQATLAPTGQPGDFIAVGAVSNASLADGGITGGQRLYSFPIGSGNNTIVGGTGNDLIISGAGSNTVVLGPGNNTYIGGTALIQGATYTEFWWPLLTSSVTINNNMPEYRISMPALFLQGGGGFTPSTQLASLQSYNQYNCNNSWYDITGMRRIASPATATHPALITTSWSISTSSPQSQFNPYGPYYETYPSTPAGNSHDTIFAGSGNNLIIGSNGGNYIDAGSGNSNVFSGGGDDVIFGGSGNSLINAQGGNDYVVASSGNHRIWGGAGNNTIYGGSGDNVIYSGIGAWNWADINAGNNFVHSGAGNTTIYGSGGGDTLVSGSEAGSGKTTTIYAGNGNETIFGGNGDDTIYGGAGANTIYAGDGNTTIRLSRNANETSTVYGGNGNDTIYSGAGNDILMGGMGDDTYVFNIGSGVDTIADTSGKNKIVFGAGVDPASVTLGLGSLLIKTGNGEDAIHIQGFDPNNVQASPIIENFQFAEGTTLSHAQLLERGFDIDGTAGDDTLTGTNINDRISGGNGNDVLNGGKGDDVLMGGVGSDTYVYNLGDGADVIRDTSVLNTSDFNGNRVQFWQPNTLEPGVGITADMINPVWDGAALTLNFGAGDNVAIGILNDLAVQNIVFSDGASITVAELLVQRGIVTQDGSESNDVMATFGNGLPLQGGAGDDELYGSAANDMLTGGTGDDLLVGGIGNDTYAFNLGDGADTIEDSRHIPYMEWLSDSNTIKFDSGITPDMIEPWYDPDSQTATLIVGADGDSINIGSINDLAIQNVELAGGQMLTLDQLIAMSGGFSQIGSAESDALHGTDMGDRLIGLAGDDSLYGDDGEDTLVGGQGNDYLNGGNGNDTYVFNRGNGEDVIYDQPWHWVGEGDRMQDINVLALGGGITADMLVSHVEGGNTVLDFGNGDSVNIGEYSSDPEQDRSAIQEIRFADGGIFAINDVLNGAVLQQRLTNQLIWQDDQFEFTVPNNPFFEPDGVVYTYSAVLANGSALPSWLSFNSATGTFTGVASNWDVGSLDVSVTATDESGNESSGNFRLDVLNVNDAPTVEMPLLDASVEVGQSFSYELSQAAPPQNSMADPTDMGTADLVWPNYDNFLHGSGGDDIYTFARGDGNVYIYDWDNSPADAVQFVDVLPGDISISQDQWGDVILSVTSITDNLTLEGWLNSDQAKVEQVIFADGTVWGVDDIRSRLSEAPTAGSDHINGTNSRDTIVALSGDDAILAGMGNDTVLAGAGHDVIDGGGGSDILIGGSGSDDISGDWNYSDINNDFLDGGAGDDYIYGSISNDLLMGGAGEDEIAGNDGSDVVLFNRGDGNDWVYSDSENGVPLAQRSDTLSLGGGITYDDLSFSTSNGCGFNRSMQRIG